MQDFLPIGLFGLVMGLSVARQLAHIRYGTPEEIALALAVLGVIAFILMVIRFTATLVTAFGALQQKLRRPITGKLLGTIPISLLQFAIVVVPVALPAAHILRVIGAAGAILFVWLTVIRWTRQPSYHHSMPGSMELRVCQEGDPFNREHHDRHPF